MPDLQTKQPVNIGEWFDSLVESIRTDELLLEADAVSDRKKVFYEHAINGNTDELFRLQKNNTQQYFVTKIIISYAQHLASLNIPIRKLAFYFNDSEVLVWVEINDNDEETEKALIMAEAKINADYYTYGFDMCSTIVEESDNLEIPAHYKVAKA